MTICASFLLFIGSVFLVGCGDSGVVEIKVGDQQDSGLTTVDADGDGFGVDEGDCDDQDAAVGPGAEDVVGDGIDQNCDGLDGVDGDSDGVASIESGGRDCDDDDPNTYPGADETCDGSDNNCDGTVDESSAIDASTWYIDLDLDGSGDSTSFEIACYAPEGFVRNGTDCDDSDPSRDSLDVDGDGYSTCDGDCDDTDAVLELSDGDGDGYSTCDGDCADNDPDLNPVDNDGDGFSTCDDDCDDADAALDPSDSDGDGYSSCDDDCDDFDDLIGPDATDGLFEDRNCDDVIDGTTDSFSQKILGDSAGDSAGYAIAVGDVDGDGLKDFLIGSVGDADGGTLAGAVHLLLGSTLGSSTVYSLASADYKFIGENASDYVGFAVASGGDVDGDGLDDMVISAPYEQEGGQSAGAVYVVFSGDLGSDATIDLRYVERKIIGETGGDLAGHSVTSTGDVDGDGLADILIGAYGHDSGGVSAGAAYVVLGSTLQAETSVSLKDADYRIVGERVGDFAGYSVDYLGDVDGDGLDDLIIGAIGEDELGENSGASYIVLGASLGLEDTLDLSNADYKLMGEDADECSGTSVSGAGDVDGDGLDDIVIGAPQDNDVVSYGGAAYVVLGASLGQTYEIDLADADYKLEGAVGGEYAGTAVQGLGDVDGDGLDDIWIGAPGGLYAKVAGKAYLVFGSSLSLVGTMSLDDADAIWTGETPTNNQYGTSFGYSAVPAGDLDGDGLGDVLVGARADNDGGQYAGAVYIGLTGE